jgi:hypothetical protein
MSEYKELKYHHPLITCLDPNLTSLGEQEHFPWLIVGQSLSRCFRTVHMDTFELGLVWNNVE